MLNPAAAGRRLSRRIALLQALAAGLVAAGFLALGGRAALGALLGGLAVAAGGALMGWRSFAGGAVGPGRALLQLVGGIALKWLVVVLVLYLALAVLALDPLAVLCGVLAALAMQLFALTFKA